jgi:endonuclease/exonuclease/phosphatase family metal-dependent hydrolase
MPTGSIRVATYNIHKCRGIDRRISPTRILEVIGQLDADLIAIQEILNVASDEPELRQARYLAENLNGYFWCFGENRVLRGGPYGNMTLSRYPIRFCHNYDVALGLRFPDRARLRPIGNARLDRRACD